MLLSQDDLDRIDEEYQAVYQKYRGLLNAYVYRNYNNAKAREFATHGFSRRLKILLRCINNIFQIVPPDRADVPSSEELSDVNINLHTFIINVFGCVDNLAWIWMCENDLKKKDGSPIPNEWVGLRPKNTRVRETLSPDFTEYLDGLDQWFDNLENFRHALAHRIPLYVPPYVLTEDGEKAYENLETRKTEALNRGAFEDYDRLSEEQDVLGEFKPFMTHSFIEEAKYVVFHAQLIADFNTIEELGWKMLEELNR